MGYPRICLASGSIDPWTLETSGAPRDAEALDADLRRTDSPLVIVHGPGDASTLAATARDMDISLAGTLHTGPSVDVRILGLHGEPAHHDAACGQGHHAATCEALSRPGRVRIVLHLSADTTDADMTHVAEQVRARAESLTLTGSSPRAASLLDTLWRALEGSNLELHLDGLALPPDASAAPVRRGNAQLVSLRMQGGWLPGLAGGVTGHPDAATAHALGMPRRDVDYRPAVDAPAGAVHIVVPHLGDVLLCTSTLPGLARELEALGVPTTLHTVWSPPWNLHVPHPNAPGWDDPDPARPSARLETAKRFTPSFLQHLDLTGAETIVVPGLEHARILLDHPTCPPKARVVVLDLHMLQGIDALQPWPDRIRCVSCFPSYLTNYLRKQVPLAAMRWFPYPLDRQHLPLPERTDGPWRTAGNQRRRLDLLAKVAATLDQPIEVWTSHPVPAPLISRGTTTVQGLYSAIAGASRVVLPVCFGHVHASGITVAALARHARRPVVGSRVWGLIDHLEQAALVPNTVEAFVDAMAAPPIPPANDDLGSTATLAHAIATGHWPLWPRR